MPSFLVRGLCDHCSSGTLTVDVVIIVNVAAAVLAALGLILGLLVAGGVTLRPDHTPYVAKAQSALKEGKYVLTVHASSSEQLKEATTVLKNRNVRLVRTI
ncbi:MAG: hypothetical protein VYC10_05135 [Pseudomonadota bacterium]|nr:hypothetical protein [Pseudomonadota bacterium]